MAYEFVLVGAIVVVVACLLGRAWYRSRPQTPTGGEPLLTATARRAEGRVGRDEPRGERR